MSEHRAALAGAAQVQNARERGQQRIEWARVTAQKAANELRSLRAAAVDGNRNRQWAPAGALVRCEVELGTHARRARNDVRISLREDDDIARLQPDRGLAEQAAPARAG